jgi:NAD(P)-dependent dehydrogenase (short-subunit alcohol dehydrogenase family)
MPKLNEKVALVTGAGRGVGKGIALELIEAGATVYITGRSVEDMRYISGKGITIECDHREDEQVRATFRRLADEQGRLDILVNNIWGGYENMVENGEFTWSHPFWQQPLWRWDAMFQPGVRSLCRQPTGRAVDGEAKQRVDSEYLVLGRAETHRKCRIWRRQSRHRQNDSGYVTRIART